MTTQQLTRFVVATLCVATPMSAYAQAWTPAQGAGVVTLDYVYYHGGDHLFGTDEIDGLTSRGYVADGNRWPLGQTTGHSLIGSIDYGIVDRLAIRASIAWVASKYEGRAPVNLDVDDGEYNAGWQDFGLDLRGILIDRALVVTPFIGYGFPTQQYPLSGHAAIGRGLSELRVGVAAGWTLEEVLSGLYLHGRYTYGVALESVADFTIKRSVIDAEIGYLIGGFAIMGIGAVQYTYGGQDWVDESFDPNQPIGHDEILAGFHNQVDNVRYARLGVGVSLPLFWGTSLNTSVFTTVWGKNVEDGNLFMLGLGIPFGTPFKSKEDNWGEDW